MPQHAASPPPPLSLEQRRVVTGLFERAKQVLVDENFDYAIQLLLKCCKLDPANLTIRLTLRQAEKTKYKNNLRGSRMALLSTAGVKVKIKNARRAGENLKVLDLGEEALTSNPWDVGVQLDMAHAAEGLGLIDLAIWFLFQIRETKPDDVAVNRFLARLCEKRGNFKEAILLWEAIRRAVPNDAEAQAKSKDLAASNTIRQGRYEDAVSTDAEPEAEEEPEVEASAAQPPPPPGRERVPPEELALRDQIKTTPANWDLYLRLAAYYRRAGALDQARQVLEQGLEPTGRNIELVLALADLAVEPSRCDLALAEKQLESRPGDEELLQTRQRLLQEINGRELELYRRKVERYPNDKSLRLELGVRLLRAGQVDDAIRELQPVRNDPRHQWRALLYLGYCFKSRKHWRLAEGNFEEALKKLPPQEEDARKEILFELAQGAAEDGDLHKAVERAYELANFDFNHGDIGRLLDEWQKRLKSGVH